MRSGQPLDWITRTAISQFRGRSYWGVVGSCQRQGGGELVRWRRGRSMGRPEWCELQRGLGDPGKGAVKAGVIGVSGGVGGGEKARVG